MCHNKIGRKLVFLQPLITSKQAITVMKIDRCQMTKHKPAASDLILSVKTWPRPQGQGHPARDPAPEELHPCSGGGLGPPGALLVTTSTPCFAHPQEHGCCPPHCSGRGAGVLCDAGVLRGAGMLRGAVVLRGAGVLWDAGMLRGAGMLWDAGFLRGAGGLRAARLL